VTGVKDARYISKFGKCLSLLAICSSPFNIHSPEAFFFHHLFTRNIFFSPHIHQNNFTTHSLEAFFSELEYIP
jgi:hypothetical protein